MFLCITLGGVIFFVFSKAERAPIKTEKSVTVIDAGLSFSFSQKTENTVGEFLQSENIAVAPEDWVLPAPAEPLYPGTQIVISRAKPYSVRVDGEEKKFTTHALTVEEALGETGLILEEDDIVKPERDVFLSPGATIKITRVEIKEEVTKKPIAFATKTEEDAELSWRIKKIKISGVNGTREITYRVSYHDGKEVGRKQIKSEVTKEPVTEVVVQGTLVKVGKKHTGVGTWYAHTGTLAAASPWLPMGSYARVTNEANGKSVIVKINDRGPFGPNRIIDLDKVAFEKIASLGAGIINVKVEEITN